MLIFMEFCDEGTLENLVAATEGGLPEPLIRQYTRQLLSAVETLHNHFVAHRDIKSANIFLTDQGNCLKLGDFGSAVKIKMHTTMPGELQGFVGTQGKSDKISFNLSIFNFIRTQIMSILIKNVYRVNVLK